MRTHLQSCLRFRAKVSLAVITGFGLAVPYGMAATDPTGSNAARLPSTSPAHAALRPEDKLAIWKAMIA